MFGVPGGKENFRFRDLKGPSDVEFKVPVGIETPSDPLCLDLTGVELDSGPDLYDRGPRLLPI